MNKHAIANIIRMEIGYLEIVGGLRLIVTNCPNRFNYTITAVGKQEFIGNFQIFRFDKAFADSIERLFLQGIFAVNKYVNATLPHTKEKNKQKIRERNPAPYEREKQTKNENFVKRKKGVEISLLLIGKIVYTRRRERNFGCSARGYALRLVARGYAFRLVVRGYALRLVARGYAFRLVAR